ncbi:hypothetical protein CISIN_1g035082mg [Citrus sinensis]|uniref:Uncharacterized protein n=1 Tax=Citrus sinensis TaxID=2711 RepID=A0A067GHG7_CITSI|nr:hypothetical protein CISIN_1g035082mg [Citrus sinensis]
MHMFNPMAENLPFADGIIYGQFTSIVLDQDSRNFSDTEIKNLAYVYWQFCSESGNSCCHCYVVMDNCQTTTIRF